MKPRHKNSPSRGVAVTARQKIFGRLSLHQYRLLVRADKDHYVRIGRLCTSVGLVSAAVEYKQREMLGMQLERLAAFTLGWIEVMTNSDNVLVQVHQERERQRALLRAGELPFDCSSPVADDQRKLVVLLEEAGEVADALLAVEDTDCKSRRAHMVKKLVQVAAVAVAWLESLEAK